MTAEAITSEMRGEVLVLTLDNPPSNALTPPMRRALLARLQNPEGARAIVIRAEGAVFCSVVAADRDREMPDLQAVCLAVSTCAVPVVVAVHGSAMGPGAELALAAHGRVAGAGARFAWPDIAVGLPPEAGATQRLPMLVGPAAALRILLSGRAVAAEEALSLGLVDRVVTTNETDAAIDLAVQRIGQTYAKRDVVDAATYQVAITAARREHRSAMPAFGRIIDCVEAAMLLPLENGLALERVAREDLEASDDARALRWAVAAERRAMLAPPAGVPGGEVRVEHIGLNGTGPGMASLAALAVSRGFAVTWVAEDANALARGVSWTLERLQAEDRAGRLPEGGIVAARSRLTEGAARADLARTDLVVHALTPDPNDRALAPTLQLVMGGEVGEIGLALARSGRMSELAVPDGVEPQALARTVDALRRLGAPALLVGQRPILGRRLAAAGETALARLIGLGVPRRLIAAALEGFGARLPDAPLPDLGSAFRQMPEAEVLDRWLGALANEGLKLLDAGVALRPSDIDHCLIAGQGFPRWRGGAMYQADRRGLMVLRHDLRRWAEDDAVWAPAPFLDRLISDGQRLAAMNG